MNLYTEQQMRDAIKMARNGARSEDNIIDSLNFIKQHSEVTMSNNKQIEKPLELPHQETIVGTNTIQTKPFDNQKIMSNNKQQPQPENLNNQFSNTEPLTHAQRVAIANQIDNNKQQNKKI